MACGHPNTMTTFSITGLIYLFCYALMSAGRLLPPQNLTVEVLDFRGKAKWNPGLGNPPNTRYTVELQQIGEAWADICTNIEATKCTLNFKMTLDDLMKYYFVRVKATWRGKSSDWITHHALQPYGEALLSAPTLNLSYHERNLSILVDMPQSVLSVCPGLTYFIQVFQKNNGLNISGKCKQGERGEASRVCENLILGQKYCVIASAIFFQQQQKQHNRSEDCIFLPSETSVIIWIAVMGALLLLVMAMALILTALHFYLKPRTSDLHMPKSLKVVRGTGRTMMALPYLPEAPTLTVSLWNTSASLESFLTLLEDQPFSPWGYECRPPLSCQDFSDDESDWHGGGGVLLWPADKEWLAFPYSQAWYRDDHGDKDRNWSPQGKDCVRERLLGELLENGGWQLDQVSSLDVPITSLSLCIDCAEEEGHKGEKTDSDVEGGASLDIGADLLSPPFRDSLGCLAGALEISENPHTHMSSTTYPSGYEPRPEPCSREPLCSTHRVTFHPASPMFEQSELYLKR